MNETKRAAILPFCLLAVAALTGCSKKEPSAEPVVTVQAAMAQRTSMQEVVTAEAVLFPKNEAAITPKVVAPVRRFYVNRGSRVHKGQLLATLENRDLAASLTENKGALAQAEAAYESTTRAALPESLKKAEYDAKAAREALDAQQKLYDSRQKLFQEGALPRKDLDQASVGLAQARTESVVADEHLASQLAVEKRATTKSAAGQLDSAKGKYDGAQAQLSYTEIRSPIDGVVTERPVWPGETSPQGTPILTVMDTSSVTARAHIPQEQAARLKPGDAATISAPAISPIPAKVTIVSPALDTGSTTVEVWVEAKNKTGVLRPGSTVHVAIVAQTISDAVAVPVEALLKTAGSETTVMMVGDHSRAHQTPVETGIRSGDLVQITKGLNAGQTVITSGAYGLPDNTQVKVAAGEHEAGNGAPGATD
jgi:HlyD family secretion protein